MAKAVEKKTVKTKRRLKKSIRKTLGTLFLISALVIAAIPTENLQAADPSSMGFRPSAKSIEVEDIFQYVPKVTDSATIYTTGDGRFQFAYVSPTTGQESGTDNRVAVILGYSNIGELPDGLLQVPDSVEAYRKYSLSTTDSGYAAVNMSNEFLYYMRLENRTDAQGNIVYELGGVGDRMDEAGYKLDENGDRVPQKVQVYYPCYYTTRSAWVNDATLYVRTNTSTGANPVYDISSAERISAATVAYIGSQYLNENNGEWTIAGVVTSEEQGIFYGQTNIFNLVLGTSMMGIGNYAFARCAGLDSITLRNGLKGMGNYAFANCVNLTNANIDLGASVPIIGSHAFYNCQRLETFTMPIGVQQIGDAAFEGCTSLKNIKLISEEKNGLLSELGLGVFKDCTSLENIEFPATFENNGRGVDVSEFQGCTSLKYIKTSNNNFKLSEGDHTTYDFDSFKTDTTSSFYLEGPKNQALHQVATAEQIAFRFYDAGLEKYVYELVVEESDGKKATYWVDDNNQLVKCDMDAQMSTVTLPEHVGPKYIASIGSMTFQNKCYLKKITIPSSVTTIEDNAFKGCHHLEDVIFNNAENISSIGTGAFDTQNCTLHEATESPEDQKQTADAYLNFTGTISSSSVPFQYAMDPSQYVDRNNLYRTYITYYSGWPTNLAVRYNEITDRNELIDYPTFADLQSGKYSTANYAYITEENQQAARDAVAKYTGTYTGSDSTMTDYEKQIISTTLNLNLPEGIEAIATVNATTGELVEDISSVSNGNPDTGVVGLFTYKESKEAMSVNGQPLSKSLSASDIREINPGAFRNCDTLTSVTFTGPLKSIGNYAFDNCERLSDVNISESTSQLGLRPFTGCDALSDVNFNGSQYFTCDNSIIYELDSAGNKSKIVEYLRGRKIPTIEADEVAGITAIYPEAFMDTGVMSADLSETTIDNLPTKAFSETPSLFSVILPNTCRSISSEAFSNSGITQVRIPDSVSVINNDAFDGTDKSKLYFVCPEGSVASIFATENGIAYKTYVEPVYYKVTFFDWDGTLLSVQERVEEGTAATPPEVPGREGYTFTGWVPPVDCVTENMSSTAAYEIIDPDTLKVTVQFVDWDDTVLKEVRLAIGESAEPPKDPYREGYTFIGWRNSYENVQEDVTIYAQYEKIDSSSSQHVVRFLDWDETVLSIQKVENGGDAIIPKDPTRAGYTFERWLPSPTNVTTDLDVYAIYTSGSSDNNNGNNNNGNNNNGNNNGNNNNSNNNNGNSTNSGNGSGNNTNSGNGSNTNNGTTSKLYTLTVQNGSGSGSYVAGSQPIIIANDPSSTQEFSHWTISPESTKIASTVLTATVITMPEGDVTVTAHYKSRSSSSNGSGTSSSSNSSRPNNRTNTVNNGGTTVVIDKNGLSNTGVVSATVNGSSDNFVIKITDSTDATEAVVKALQNEYGSLDNIKYFPMDISLYDSTGNNKITDTTGLSVSITLPLPDSMITYAGNNKVAGVVNERLDKLTPKFTTISGVSCITFTAEHFSPYVIYVDTENLSAGVTTDATPKTGDAIHPKWFLSIGLACLSFVMFMQKDRRKPKKVKARA